MAKQKVWYKNIKEGDVVILKLLPGHTWYQNQKDKELEVTILRTYFDGAMAGNSSTSLSDYVSTNLVLMGWEGTNWNENCPVNILRKVKKS